MKTAQEIRDTQNAEARRVAEAKVAGFATKVEQAVEDAASYGMHQISLDVPKALVASVAAIGLGYGRLGYMVKIETERGYFGSGLFKPATTILTLGW